MVVVYPDCVRGITYYRYYSAPTIYPFPSAPSAHSDQTLCVPSDLIIPLETGFESRRKQNRKVIISFRLTRVPKFRTRRRERIDPIHWHRVAPCANRWNSRSYATNSDT